MATPQEQLDSLNRLKQSGRITSQQYDGAILKLKAKIRQPATTGQVTAQPGQVEASKTAEESDLNLGGNALGVLDVGLSMASGVVGDVAGGIAGLGASAVTQDSRKASEVLKNVQDTLSIQPQTEEGKRILETLGQLSGFLSEKFEPVKEALTPAFDATGEAIGGLLGKTALGLVADESQTDALGKTIVGTALTALPDIVGGVAGKALSTEVPSLKSTAGTRELAQGAGSEVEAIKAGDPLSQEGRFGELLPAQRVAESGREGILDTQAFLQSLPQTQKLAAQKLKKQDSSAFEAVKSVFNEFGPELDQVGIGGRATKAASDAIGKATKKRQRESGFDVVFENAPEVSPNNALEAIAEERGKAAVGGSVAGLLDKYEKLITDQGGNAEKLFNIKKELDFEIEKLSNSPNKNLKRIATSLDAGIKQDLMEQVSGFKQANDKFRKLSPPIDTMKTLVGGISKEATPFIDKTVSQIFSPTANVSTIRETKKIIQSQSKGVWNGIVRAELERRLGKSTANEDTDFAKGNAPLNLSNKIFGNNKQRSMLLEAAGTEQRKNLIMLEEWLKRASLGRGTGSPTAGRTDLVGRMKEGPLGKIFDTLTSPRKKIQESGAQKRADISAQEIADVFLNPDFADKMKVIRSEGLLSPKGGLLMGELLRQAAQEEEGG